MNDPFDPDKIDVFWSEAERLTEAGELRRLSGAFARFVASLGPAPGPLLLASLVLCRKTPKPG